MWSKIQELFSESNSPTITFNEMATTTILTDVILDKKSEGKIVAQRVPLSSTKYLVFRNEGEKGARYIRHRHDCKEVCWVESGAVKFTSSKGTRTVTPETGPIRYPLGVYHDAEWIETGVMYVEFEKVYK